MTTTQFRGACDASAAIRIPGTTCFVTASDEDYVLRAYDLDNPGPVVSDLNVTDFLEPVDRSKEPDIEGGVLIGNRIYWIGSHGRDKGRVEQESRQRLFATEVSVAASRPVMRTVGKPYKKLLHDLVSAPDLSEFDIPSAAARAPEEPEGFNIEGLAVTPEGHLFVGLRNPIPRGRALIIRIHNPADVVSGEARAKVSKGALLDLGGRGIRAIEGAPDGRYYVLAGSFDDTRNFALFSWDGLNSTPSLLMADAALNDLNPEELIVLPHAAGGHIVQLFSDDGDRLVGEKKCKKVDIAARSFRVAAVQLAV